MKSIALSIFILTLLQVSAMADSNVSFLDKRDAEIQHLMNMKDYIGVVKTEWRNDDITPLEPGQIYILGSYRAGANSITGEPLDDSLSLSGSPTHQENGYAFSYHIVNRAMLKLDRTYRKDLYKCDIVRGFFYSPSCVLVGEGISYKTVRKGLQIID